MDPQTNCLLTSKQTPAIKLQKHINKPLYTNNNQRWTTPRTLHVASAVPNGPGLSSQQDRAL